MSEKPLRENSIKMAVDIAIAAVPIQNATMINYPDAVAKFIEIVAQKIDELRGAQ